MQEASPAERELVKPLANTMSQALASQAHPWPCGPIAEDASGTPHVLVEDEFDPSVGSGRLSQAIHGTSQIYQISSVQLLSTEGRVYLGCASSDFLGFLFFVFVFCFFDIPLWVPIVKGFASACSRLPGAVP